jgi:hypothetical protein
MSKQLTLESESSSRLHNQCSILVQIHCSRCITMLDIGADHCSRCIKMLNVGAESLLKVANNAQFVDAFSGCIKMLNV